MNEVILKVTLMDIARKLNITAATVSRALNNHPAIKEATKKIVRAAAKELQYQPNKIASLLRSGRSNIIGVIIPSAKINFFGSVIHGIEKIANENNYNVLIYQTNELYEYEKRGVQTFFAITGRWRTGFYFERHNKLRPLQRNKKQRSTINLI